MKKVYYLSSCSTCKRIIKTLNLSSDFELQDLKTNPLTPEDLGRAISQEDIGAIEKVPGIGRKGAQRLILELKGKLSDLSSVHPYKGHQPAWREQLTSALVNCSRQAG